MNSALSTPARLYKIKPEHFRRPLSLFWLLPLRFGLILLLWLMLALLLDAIIPGLRITSSPLASGSWLLSTLRGALMFSVLYTGYLSWTQVRQRRSKGFELAVEPDRLVEYKADNIRTVYRNRLQEIRELRGFLREPGLLIRADYEQVFIPEGQPEYAEIKAELAKWNKPIKA
jgi:hypothetical protein